MVRATADPTPCDRCRHRRDLHEVFRGLRVCRACDYIAMRWPCSMATVRDEATLERLSFDVENGPF